MNFALDGYVTLRCYSARDCAKFAVMLLQEAADWDRDEAYRMDAQRNQIRADEIHPGFRFVTQYGVLTVVKTDVGLTGVDEYWTSVTLTYTAGAFADAMNRCGWKRAAP